jgi:conjugative transfer signal peptidase TraF
MTTLTSVLASDPGDRETPRRRRWPILAFAAAVSALALGGAFSARPFLLFNTTPSEPTGLYVETPDRPADGRLVAFKAPAAAFPYADGRLAYLRHTTLLKAVAASAGEDVCTLAGRLRINGRDRAPIAAHDGFGVELPHWSGCRRLAANELFVFSDRVPNSFDSRYFGPVDRSAVVGVYAPIFKGRGGS